MRIFELTPYVYKQGIKEYERNKTGFGIVVADIVWGLSINDDITLATNVPKKEKKTDNINILNFSMIKIVIYLFSANCISNIIKFIKNYNTISIKNIYYCALASYFIHYLKKHKQEFDVVHIHGICLVNKIVLDYLDNINFPTVLTLHGLIKDAHEAPKELVKMEDDMLSTCEIKFNEVSVVSSGVQDKIVKQFINIKCSVIYNGTNVSNILKPKNHSSYYQLVAIGNIGPLKNQIQIIDALQYVNPEILKQIKLKIIGGYADITDINNKIKELGVEQNVELLGFLDKEKINSILESTDLNILASINEGFGMSIIESLSFGIPSVFFNSIDISDDIDDKMCVKIDSKSSKDLAKGIEFALIKEWNRQELYQYSFNFTKTKLIDNYHKLLSESCY